MEFKENKENGTESCVLRGEETLKPRADMTTVEQVQRNKLKQSANGKKAEQVAAESSLVVTAMRKKLEIASSFSQENCKAKGKKFEQQQHDDALSQVVQVKAIRKKLEQWNATNTCNSQNQVKAMRKKFEQEAPVSQTKVKAARKKFEQEEVVSQDKVARKRRKIEQRRIM